MIRLPVGITFVLSLLLALVLQLLLLPAPVSYFVPLWLPLALCYWSVFGPNLPVLLAAFICGLVLDVAYASPLGQNALGLVICAYITTSTRVSLGRMGALQQGIVLVPVFAVICLLLFWLDGMSRHMAQPLARFGPALTSGLVWPLMVAMLDATRGRAARGR